MRTQRDRTIKGYNLDICDALDCSDGGMPSLDPVDATPGDLKSFSVGEAKWKRGVFAHFFLDDYRIERLWRRPAAYDRTILGYAGALSPDFSLYVDMPLPMQMWNSYRSKALARHWQDIGATVIPTLCWSDERSYGFAFDGIPTSSTVAVSTVGVCRSATARAMFADGLHAAVEKLAPTRIIWYGAMLDGIDAGAAEVIHYQNDNSRRVRKWEEEAREAAAGRRTTGS